MKLVAYNPWKLFDELQAGMGGFVRPARRGVDDQNSEGNVTRWWPTVDIKEERDRFVLYADIPGVDPTDIEVTMEKGVLTIKGERSAENKEEGDRFSRLERSHGVFYRRFVLPTSADADRVEAHGKHGVLEVLIPKREEHQPRRIPIAA